jgi:hypothetical protein
MSCHIACTVQSNVEGHILRTQKIYWGVSVAHYRGDKLP